MKLFGMCKFGKGGKLAATDHVLYLAYNMGPTGAQWCFDKGIYSSAYTWQIMALYDKYMAEVETT